MSPFNLYQQAHRAATAEEVTAVGSVHERHVVGKDGHEINNFVNRLLGKKWKQLQEEERLPYYWPLPAPTAIATALPLCSWIFNICVRCLQASPPAFVLV